MDLTTIKATDRLVYLTHPKSGEELGLVFELRSPHDDAVREIEREWQNSRLHPKRRRRTLTVEELESLQNNRILAAVKGWTWEDDELSIHNEQPEYSRQQLKDWLKDPDLIWIRDFLVEETEDLASFF